MANKFSISKKIFYFPYSLQVNKYKNYRQKFRKRMPSIKAFALINDGYNFRVDKYLLKNMQRIVTFKVVTLSFTYP